MYNRELTQLISAAKHYLQAAEALAVPGAQLDTTVASNSANWPSDRKPCPLSLLDEYSAHLASCAARLATIQEILHCGTQTTWALAYPEAATISTANVASAQTQALEILLRDYVGHAEDDPGGKAKRAAFRKAALEGLTFREIGERLRIRFEKVEATL